MGGHKPSSTPFAGLGTPLPGPVLMHQWVAVEAERLFVQDQTEITPSNTAHLPACMSRMSASHAVSPYSAQAFTVCLKAAGSYPQCKSVFRKKAGRSGEQCDLNGLSSVQGSSLQTLWVTWHFFASRDTRSTTTITQSMDFGMIAGGLLNGLHGYDPRENDARVTDNYFETLQNGNRAS
ncbi:hypothetical protein CIHG_06815 [Coccidioides immitis H538.4]|uniref:Uncharacterized protein n=1 Tax=Coccidioides immitis H538.4 TaxID=396776 RepID=A0A0J8RXU3_COCIT|nr:hypothetical protein CIHG_06815 [Coccidioides immitis H538.4]